MLTGSGDLWSTFRPTLSAWVAVRGSTVLRLPAHIFGGRHLILLTQDNAMCPVFVSDVKSLTREITEGSWCDKITIFKYHWFGAEMKVEATDAKKLETMDKGQDRHTVSMKWQLVCLHLHFL